MEYTIRSWPRAWRMAAALLMLTASAAPAATLTTQIDGVDGAMKTAVNQATGIEQYASREVSAAQAHRLYEQALKKFPQRWSRSVTTTPMPMAS